MTNEINLDLLNFNEETHVYTYDGAVLDNVTYILRFLNGDMNKVDPAVLAQAAERGTRVHEATLVYDMEHHIDCDPDIEGYIRAYAAFLRDYRVSEWAYYEKPVTDGKIAGTFDRLGKVGGVMTLVDIKSGQFRRPNHYGQLAGYTRLIEACMPDIEIGAHMVVCLKADGKYVAHQATSAEMVFARSIWNNCKYLQEDLDNLKEVSHGK